MFKFKPATITTFPLELNYRWWTKILRKLLIMALIGLITPNVNGADQEVFGKQRSPKQTNALADFLSRSSRPRQSQAQKEPDMVEAACASSFKIAPRTVSKELSYARIATNKCAPVAAPAVPVAVGLPAAPAVPVAVGLPNVKRSLTHPRTEHLDLEEASRLQHAEEAMLKRVAESQKSGVQYVPSMILVTPISNTVFVPRFQTVDGRVPTRELNPNARAWFPSWKAAVKVVAAQKDLPGK